MARVRPQGNNADAAAKNLEMVIKAGRERSEQSLHVLGMAITNQVKINITKNFPPASEPGTPPALRTGGLRKSYKYAVNPSRGRKVASLSVYSDRTVLQPVPPHKEVIYASYLEFGTSKMKARPHLRPAVEQIRPLINFTFRAAWAAGVQEAARRGRRR